MRANYRKSMLHSLPAAVGNFNTATEFAKTVTVFDAIQWISSAWNNVQEESILQYFRRAAFATPETDLQERVRFSQLTARNAASEDDILENEPNISVHENV